MSLGLFDIFNDIRFKNKQTQRVHKGPMRGYYPYEIVQRKGLYFPILGYLCGGKKIVIRILKRHGLLLKLRLKNWRPLKQTKAKVTSFYQLLKLYYFAFLPKMIPSL